MVRATVGGTVRARSLEPAVGAEVGEAEGAPDGLPVGDHVGAAEGAKVGLPEGADVGAADGIAVA